MHEGPRKGRLRVSSFIDSPVIVPFSPNTSNIQGASNRTRDERPFVNLVICPHGSINPLSMQDFEAIVVAGGGTFAKSVALVDPEVIQATVEAVKKANGVIDNAVTKVDGEKKCIIITQPRVKGFNKNECIGQLRFSSFKIVKF